MLIDPRPSDDPALTLLLDLALKELFTRYPDSPSTHWVDPATGFLVALEDGDGLGCIGLMPVQDGVGEIKRMFVHEHHRGRGIARRLVASVEAVAARHRGATALRLDRHPPAGGGRPVRIARLPGDLAVREVRSRSAGPVLRETAYLTAMA